MKKLTAFLLLLGILLTGCSTVESTSSGSQVTHTGIPLSELLNESSSAHTDSSDVTSAPESADPSSGISSETETSSELSSQTSSETSSQTSSETSSQTSSETSSQASSETCSQTSSKTNSNEYSANEGDIVIKTPTVAFEEPEVGDWTMVMVNAKNPISDDFKLNLVNYNEYYQIDARILPALNAMMQAAKKDGISIYPCSIYRSKERSAYLYQKQVQKYLDLGYSESDAKIVASHWVAPPGTSEHHTGLAIDFLSNESTTMNETFAETKAAKWLLENAESYGFILRYPKGKESITGIVFEPWHYRYVGTKAAAEIMQNDLTLEEYLGYEPVGYEEIE